MLINPHNYSTKTPIKEEYNDNLARKQLREWLTYKAPTKVKKIID